MGFLRAFGGSCMGVMFFMVIAVGITALLEFAFGVDRTLAAIIGMACWYGVQFFIKQHLKRKAAEVVNDNQGAEN